MRGKLDLGFADLGAQQVKNIAQAVPIYRVLLDPGDAGKVVAAARRPARRGVLIGGLLLVALLGVAGFLLRDRLMPVPEPEHLRVLILPYRAAGDRVPAEAVSENLWLTMARLKGITIVPRDASLTLKGSIRRRNRSPRWER